MNRKYFSSVKEDIRNIIRLSDSKSRRERALSASYFRRRIDDRFVPPEGTTNDLIDGLIGCLFLNYGSAAYDAATALTNYTCISHSICLMIMQNNGLIALKSCVLYSDDNAASEQACWVIGNIAVDCADCHRDVVRSGMLNDMIERVNNEQFFHKHPNHRKFVWMLAQLLRRYPLDLALLDAQNLMNGLAKILQHNKSETLAVVVWAIGYIWDETDHHFYIEYILSTPDLLLKIVASLGNKKAMVPAIRIIGNLLTGEDHFVQQILDTNFLPDLLELFDLDVVNSSRIRKDILWCLSNIAASMPHHVDYIFEHDELEKILDFSICSFDPMLNVECCWVIVNSILNAHAERAVWIFCTHFTAIIPRILENLTNIFLIRKALQALSDFLNENKRFLPVFQELGIMEQVQKISEMHQVDNEILQRARTLLEVGEESSGSNTPATISLTYAFFDRLKFE